jgi:ABC-type multidrug transport system ATPase subunit
MTGTESRPNGQAGAIVTRNVTKRYGQVAALADVTFDVTPGEAVALWGPNGAGKTTILRCLLGLARYDGDVVVDGHDSRRDGRAVRSSIGYVPQDLPVAPMTVGEMVAFIASLKRVSIEQAIVQLDRLGIGDQTEKRIGALSGGMKQRLALALALIGMPQILLLDEPTANLDARGRAELLDLLTQLKREGLTMIFSSHRPDDILALADRILMIESGVLRRSASPEEFKHELGAASHLVLTLKNGHLREAIETLGRLGFEADGQGHVITVPIAVREKAHVIGALVRDGIEIEDFDLERAAWTDQSSLR